MITFVIVEADGERDVLNTSEEYVFLVEEQDRRCRREARMIADGVEQRQAVVYCILLMHTTMQHIPYHTIIVPFWRTAAVPQCLSASLSLSLSD